MTPLAFVLQRLSALVMAPVVIVHLRLIIYAVRGVFERRRDSRAYARLMWRGACFMRSSWSALPGMPDWVFRNRLDGWTALDRGATAAIAHVFMALTPLLGLRAVFAVTVPGSAALIADMRVTKRFSRIESPALFLRMHFLALGLALESADAMDSFLAWADSPALKFAKWALVLALALHLTGGLRLLMAEL